MYILDEESIRAAGGHTELHAYLVPNEEEADEEYAAFDVILGNDERIINIINRQAPRVPIYTIQEGFIDAPMNENDESNDSVDDNEDEFAIESLITSLVRYIICLSLFSWYIIYEFW